MNTIISESLFEERLSQLTAIAVANQKGTGDDSTEVSFHSGDWYHEEGYKRQVWTEAHKKLQLNGWNDKTDSEIVKCVLNTFSVVVGEERENLVSLPSYMLTSEVFTNDCQKTAWILKRLFRGNVSDEEDCFHDLVILLSAKRIHDPLSAIAYLFFLKDRERYVTVKKDHYRNISFPKLEISSSCLNECTWENYQTIIDIARQIEVLLERYFEDVELIDAQSFLWMMWRVEKAWPWVVKRVEPNVGIEETRVMYPDGKKTEYYVTRYERSPQNRAAAIRIHGCKCCVCGFDFEKTYGALGKNFIEVHHLVPLSSLDEEVKVNPETDLVCLCANCHRMIHRKVNAILTPEQLKHIMVEAAANSAL